MINHNHTTETEMFLNYALKYAGLGLPVIPLHPINQKGYCACGMGRDCASPGKHPKTKNGLKDATTDAEQVKKWWPVESVLPNNIGIITGGKSGLVVVDIDGGEGFVALGNERVGDLQDKFVPCVKTGRGFHYYFKSATPVKTKPGYVTKVDVKADGGYVVAPPSNHISGKVYEWTKDLNGNLPTVPSWVLNGRDVKSGSSVVAGGAGGKQRHPRRDLDGPPMMGSPTQAVSNVIHEGRRNDTLFKLACSLRAKNVSDDTALSTIKFENQKRCNPPLSETEVKNIVNSAYKYEPTKNKSFNCTDLGNAKRLVSQHGAVIRYCFAWKKWICWDGKTWHIDNTGHILRLAKDTVKHIYEEASLIIDDKQRREIAKWGIDSEAERRLHAMVSLAQSEEPLPISPNDLDINPYLLNCLNGTIDLKTGELKQHDPQDFITKIIPVEYIPGATCPKWIDYLETIFNWNYDLIPYVQRAVGYSLTGDISEQCLFILHGTGANGKSVLLKTISNLLAAYAQTADFETFLIKKNDGGIRNDIARMQGKRFISAIEAESGKRLSENLIKSLTGGDTVSARFLFGEFFDFQPTHKLWLAANHKPNIRGTDYAIWRRIRLIPFNVTIPEDKQDKHLEEKLKAELPGILAWAIQGCLEWQRNGLQTPVEVKTATNGYREEMDGIGTFLSECCILTPEVRTKSGELYEAYRKWCVDNGEFVIGNRHFGRRLSERGFQNQQSNGNWWRGIGLKV